jgi:hypothetical protein
LEIASDRTNGSNSSHIHHIRRLHALHGLPLAGAETRDEQGAPLSCGHIA